MDYKQIVRTAIIVGAAMQDPELWKHRIASLDTEFEPFDLRRVLRYLAGDDTTEANNRMAGSHLGIPNSSFPWLEDLWKRVHYTNRTAKLHSFEKEIRRLEALGKWQEANTILDEYQTIVGHDIALCLTVKMNACRTADELTAIAAQIKSVQEKLAKDELAALRKLYGQVSHNLGIAKNGVDGGQKKANTEVA